MLLMVALSYEVLDFRFKVFHGESSVFVMKFLGVSVESGIMNIFAPDSIYPDCFALSANFLLSRLTGFDYPSRSSGSLSMALLKSLMPVV